MLKFDKFRLIIQFILLQLSEPRSTLSYNAMHLKEKRRLNMSPGTPHTDLHSAVFTLHSCTCFYAFCWL